MPSDFSFDLRLQRARDEINEALGQRPMQPMPQMPMPQMQQPMPQMPTQQPQMQPMSMQQPQMQPMSMQPQMQQPMQQTAPRRFQEGGLATSLRTDPVYHDRDAEFVNTRNQHMREVAGKAAYAKGGGAWTRKEGQNPEGGLNAAGRASLRAQGHDIKPPVSAKQAKKSPKAAARRKSFCARMSGMPGPMKDDNGKPTRKALSLRKWDC